MSRTVSQTSSVIPFPVRPAFARRPIASSAPQMTAMALIVHAQTEKAYKVSDTGDAARAVWVPKVMLTVDEFSERGIIVASMSKAFAERKNLHGRSIDPTLFNEATVAVLREAEARAARKRNSYRGYRQPTPRCMNRNVFA